ncbi:MAG: hypothetical protein ACJ74Z_10995 [Bryobacteraceae bacterium]
MDIVAGGFDGAIHFGEYIEKDMIAVRVSPDQNPAIVGSPSSFQGSQLSALATPIGSLGQYANFSAKRTLFIESQRPSR